MKILLVISVLLFVNWQVDARALFAKSAEKSDGLDADDESCITELHLNREKIAAVDMSKTLPEDNDFIEYMGCTGKKKGLITSNGTVMFDMIKENFLELGRKDPDFSAAELVLYEQLMTTVVDNCKKNPPSGSTEWLTFVKSLNCINKNLHEIIDATEKSDELDADDESCITELHLNREKIAAVDVSKTLPEDNDFIEYMGCTGKKKGLITSNGTVRFDMIKENFLELGRKDPDFSAAQLKAYEQLMTTVVDNCKKNPPSGSTEGLTFVKSLNCINKNLHEIIDK